MSELTLEAKEAIRSYMLKLVILPGSLLAVLSFVGGYAIQWLAREPAYVDALRQVSSTTQQDAKTVGRALSDVDAQQKAVQADAAKVQELLAKVESSAAVSRSNQEIGSIVAGLKSDPGFNSAFREALSQESAGARQRLESLTARVERVGLDRIDGVKLCGIGVPGRWIDVLLVPSWASTHTRDSIRQFESGATSYYGCIYNDGSVDLGPGGNPPRKNCGWS